MDDHNILTAMENIGHQIAGANNGVKYGGYVPLGSVADILARLRTHLSRVTVPRAGGVPAYVQSTGTSHACPNCGMSSWYIGRQTAECASCSLPMPLLMPRCRPSVLED